MPHDKNNNLLSVGDAVVIRGKVTAITQDGDHFCNLNVETDEKMYPGDNKTMIPLNAKQVEKLFEIPGLEPLTLKQLAAVEEFRRTMRDETIPEIIKAIESHSPCHLVERKS